MKKIKLVPVFLFLLGAVHAQQFVNGDLEGTVKAISDLPTSWESVPKTDPACKASEKGYATPDLTGISGPNLNYGICGNPYSGVSFVSGLHCVSDSYYFHEGIMQTVTGLVPGTEYEISFFQSVLKQLGETDTSGSWIVYVDALQAGTSLSSGRPGYNDTGLKWERRSLYFTATKKKHTIKFLPHDDAPGFSSPSHNSGLRMGIDSITLHTVASFKIALHASTVRGVVSVQNGEKGKISLEVLDGNGKIITTKDPVERGINEIDLREQPAGEYTFKFYIEEKTYTLSYEKN